MPEVSRRTLLGISAASAAAGCGGGGTASIQAAPTPAPSPLPVDDTTALLAAIEAAYASGVLMLEPRVYNVSKRIDITKPLRIVGCSAGVNGTIIRSTAEEAVVIEPAVRIAASSGFNQRGFWFSVENLRIEPAASGGGKHGLVIRVRPGFFVSTWLIDRIHLGGFGEQGLFLDNTAGNADGIFTGQVSRCFIENGVKGVLLGDSVHFIDNVVPNRAPSPGATFPGFDLSFVRGAAESALVRNNITTSGGCIVIRNGIGVGIEHNWCESAAGVTPIQLFDCTECTIRDNRVQTLGGAAPYALVLDGSHLTVIESNKFNAGSAGHVAFLNGSSRNKLAGLNRFLGSGDVLAGQITGASTGLLSSN